MSHLSSPSGSLHRAPSLDCLVAYFVAAKRSLSVTTHVYHANEIVEDARALVEKTAVLRAKNAYIRKGVDEQVHVLQNIHDGLEAVGAEAQLDFQGVIRSLDVANDRLQATLAALRKTIVSSTLTSAAEPAGAYYGSDEGIGGVGSSKNDKALYDFIDDTTHTTLLDTLRDTIDSYNDEQASLHKIRTSLAASLRNLSSLFQESDNLRPATTGTGSSVTLEQTVPDLFHTLTTHATEMASLLQSLISHYDLCISALKHTEGGGEAARAATTDATPLGTGAESPTEASLYAGAEAESHRNPITAAERAEMLTVLDTDAAQVDDVVLEIRERAVEMTNYLAELQSHTTVAQTRFALFRSILDDLSTISTTILPTCVSSSLSFRQQWTALRTVLVEKTSSLSDLSSFYDSFLASYANLLREVERRKMVEGKMKKIADRAMREIKALQAEDEDMRKGFVKEVGEWLPRDIWPGLMDGSGKWEVRRLKGRGLAVETGEVEVDEDGKEGVLRESALSTE